MPYFVLIAGFVGLLALGAVSHRARKQRRRKTKISPTLALVRKRHALRKKLMLRLGDEFVVTERVQAEARRLNVAQSSIEALEAALHRVDAERRAGSSHARRESYHRAQERIQAERGPDYVPDPPPTRMTDHLYDDVTVMNDFGSS